MSGHTSVGAATARSAEYLIRCRGARVRGAVLAAYGMAIPSGGLRTLLLSPLVSGSIATVRFTLVANCRDELSVRIITPEVVRDCMFAELRAALGSCISRLLLLPPHVGDVITETSALPVWEWSRSAPLVLVRSDLSTSSLYTFDRDCHTAVDMGVLQEMLTAA